MRPRIFRLPPIPAGLFRRVPPLAAGGLYLSLLSGCLSISQELQEESSRQQISWQARHDPLQASSPLVILSWQDALLRLRSGNEKIRSSDLECLRAEENLSQVKRSLIPLLSMQAGYNKALTGDSVDPFTFAANVFFDVPGMVSYKIRYEAARLSLIRAHLAQEAAWREQVVELYRVFSQNARLHAGLAEINRLLPLSPDSIRSTLERQHLVATAGLDASSLQIAQLVGAPTQKFRSDAATLPPLPYASPGSPLPSAASLARLPLQLAAVELVGLRARELGVNLRHWPELSLYVTSPAIYSRSNGEDAFWSSDNIFAGANVYWTLDTRGRGRSEKRVIAFEASLRREALEREAASLAARLQVALTSLHDLDTRLAGLPALAANGASTSGSRAIDDALSARRRQLLEEREEWLLTLWFFDDGRWPGIPALPAATGGTLAAQTSPR